MKLTLLIKKKSRSGSLSNHNPLDQASDMSYDLEHFPLSEGAIPGGSHQSFSGPLSMTSESSNKKAKPSSALSRLGKAFYGTPTIQATTPGVSGAQSPTNARRPDVKRPLFLKYSARSEIVAMGPSHTENAVAVVGKDCKCSLSSKLF